LENFVEIKVQTDGSKTPAMAVIESCEKTINHVTAMQNSFAVRILFDNHIECSQTLQGGQDRQHLSSAGT